MPTYQTRNPQARANPLRSIPLFRAPAEVFGSAWQGGKLVRSLAIVAVPVATPAAAPAVDPARELANAEAKLREYIRVYEFARRGIGEANATGTAAVMSCGRVIQPAIVFTAERRRARKSAAFRLFNQRRRELNQARRRVDAARAALGLPSLAAVEGRAAVAAMIRASKVASLAA